MPDERRLWYHRIKRPQWTQLITRLKVMEKRSRISVRRSMMTEIFLNALEVAYAIFHAAVVYGWSLLIFYVYNDQGDFVGCPANPAIPIFIHTLSGTSICGLILWISGHLFDCSYKLPLRGAHINEQSLQATASTRITEAPKIIVRSRQSSFNESPAIGNGEIEGTSGSTTPENQILVLIQDEETTLATHPDIVHVVDNASTNQERVDHKTVDDDKAVHDEADTVETALEDTVVLDNVIDIEDVEDDIVLDDAEEDVIVNDETDNDKVLLIVNEPGMKFRFTFYHLAYFLVCIAHVSLIILGTFLTVPMFFTHRLYEVGMRPSVCNETLFWFAFLMVGCEYLLLATFGGWFLCDVIIAARLEENAKEDIEAVQPAPAPTPTPTS